MGQDRKIQIPRDDLITLLLNDDPQKPPVISSLSEVVQKQVENLSKVLYRKEFQIILTFIL